jgi:formamidopyrimidine-DNA glycosylase
MASGRAEGVPWQDRGMPELPDVTVYVESLRARVAGRELARVRVASPLLLRTYDPPLSAAHGRRVDAVSRLGKRIVLELESGLFLSIHLMIAGRLRWRPSGIAVPKKVGLAAFDFPDGTLLLTEASPKKRAALHLFASREGLETLDAGGLDVFAASPEDFRTALTWENHTLKRALTDPHLFDGIGNAYSDEILHRARLSPVALTSRLGEDEIERLRLASVATLTDWIERTRREVGDGFPEKVTAFREGMAVHGRAGKPCPDCGSPVQRIAYADNETNYCPTCQTGGRLLADRALSRLLRSDWPKSLEELEEIKRSRRG